GCVVAAVGAACGTGGLSGTSGVSAWGNLARVAFHSAAGVTMLGLGVAAGAWALSKALAREPAWVPIGASLMVAIMRIGLWQAFAARNQMKGDVLSNLTLLGGLLSAILFGAVIHLALKAREE